MLTHSISGEGVGEIFTFAERVSSGNVWQQNDRWPSLLFKQPEIDTTVHAKSNRNGPDPRVVMQDSSTRIVLRAGAGFRFQLNAGPSRVQVVVERHGVDQGSRACHLEGKSESDMEARYTPGSISPDSCTSGTRGIFTGHGGPHASSQSWKSTGMPSMATGVPAPSVHVGSNDSGAPPAAPARQIQIQIPAHTRYTQAHRRVVYCDASTRVASVHHLSSLSRALSYGCVMITACHIWISSWRSCRVVGDDLAGEMALDLRFSHVAKCLTVRGPST